MSLKNARTLGIRLDSEDAELLSRFEEETSVEGVSLARAALKSALKYYQATGELRLPLKVVPATPETIEVIPGYLREEPDTEYQAGKKKREA